MIDIYPSEKIRVILSKDVIFIEASDKQNTPTISYDRGTGALMNTYSPSMSNNQINLIKEKIYNVHGIIGTVKMYSGNYLMLIKKRILATMVDNHRIYKIIKAKLVPISNNKISEEQKKIENSYLESLEKIFKKKDFYFSYDYDITNSLQRMDNEKYKEKDYKPLYQKLDDIFFWNHFSTTELRNKRFDQFILPIMRGCIQVFTYLFNGVPCRFELISRRSRHKAGTRYRTRGIDENGHVANYVETEQRIFFKKKWTSLVQTRGSIPLYWEQTGKGYRPTPKIIPNKQHKEAFDKHFENQIEKYNSPQIIVNLLDYKGTENTNTQAYENEIRDCVKFKDQLIYHAFDFHSQCKNNQYQNAYFLVEHMKEEVNKMSYFKKGEKKQCGIIRTNCLDCLDRTNLMMSVFAKTSMLAQLAELGKEIKDVETEHPLLDSLFKDAWANNGDYISMQYAGTDALKGDYTRTGKRKAKGIMKDGVNSVTRYVNNRFKDEMKQLTIDIICGKYIVGVNDDSILIPLKEQSIPTEHITAMDVCASMVFNDFDERPETWILTSVNNKQKEQTRVFLVSPKAYYRCKYSFSSQKIVRFKRVPFENLRVIHYGQIKSSSKKNCYGLLFTSIEKDEIYRDMYQSDGIKNNYLNLSGQEIILVIVETIRQAYYDLNNSKSFPELKEQEIVIDKKKAFNISKNSLFLPDN
eukprot:TRINITY_DN4062_c0_g1_i1.p1 TRINITY_DN4062_c0_g1~~TRINITY_DN4062_c0_g1_i1.p1  ORF type:complete len:694 (-),score=160.36 TRINITY_DN4062_c0_g1_i1:51-2132(-)